LGWANEVTEDWRELHIRVYDLGIWSGCVLRHCGSEFVNPWRCK